MKQFQNLLLWIKKKEEAKDFWKYIVDGGEQLED